MLLKYSTNITDRLTHTHKEMRPNALQSAFAGGYNLVSKITWSKVLKSCYRSSPTVAEIYKSTVSKCSIKIWQVQF